MDVILDRAGPKSVSILCEKLFSFVLWFIRNYANSGNYNKHIHTSKTLLSAFSFYGKLKKKKFS